MLKLSLFLVLAVLMPSGKTTSVSLYDEQKDHIVEIRGRVDFSNKVYNSPRASLVEFYAHWCNYCKKFVPKMTELANKTHLWYDSVLLVAVVNCAESVNNDLCTEHRVASVPSLRLFGPNQVTPWSNTLFLKHTNRSIESMLNAIVDYVYDNVHYLSSLKIFEYI